MDINDDMWTDRLDYLYDRYQDWFDYLDTLFLDEPSPAELQKMNESAEQLLMDFIGDEE